MTHGIFRIGTSGWQYPHWVGEFYPTDQPKRLWFNHYLKYFDTVEINNTFYNLPKPSTFINWKDKAPPNFCYALKFNRYGTHIKRLLNSDQTINRFLERAELLESKLGPILVQLPPHWQLNLKRLAEFIEMAPNKYRWAIEFRDMSWLCPEVFKLLTHYQWALCIHDMMENHPRFITTNWVYFRYHGVDHHYGGSYPSEKISHDANFFQQLARNGLDVYVYFNNDAKGYAVNNALELKQKLTGI